MVRTSPKCRPQRQRRALVRPVSLFPADVFQRSPVLGTGGVCVSLTRPFSTSLAQGDISRLLEKGHYNFALTSCKPLFPSGGRSYLILHLVRDAGQWVWALLSQEMGVDEEKELAE